MMIGKSCHDICLLEEAKDGGCFRVTPIPSESRIEQSTYL